MDIDGLAAYGDDVIASDAYISPVSPGAKWVMGQWAMKVLRLFLSGIPASPVDREEDIYINIRTYLYLKIF